MTEVTVASRIRDVIRDLVNPATAARSLSSGVFWAVAITGLGTIISYGLHIFLARLLGSAEYGVYSFALGWMNIAQVAVSIELGTVATRYIGEYSAAKRWGLLAGLIRRSRQIVLGASVVTALIAAAVIVLLGQRIEPHLSAALIAACVLLPISAALQIDSRILQGFNRSIEARVPFNIARPLLLGTTVAVAAAIWSFSPRGWWAVAANAVASTVALVWTVVMLRRVLARQAEPAAPSYATGEWMRAALTFLAIASFQIMLSTQSDIVLVGAIVNTTQAGFYSAASQLAMLVGFVASVAAEVVSPRIAALQAVGDRAGLTRLIHRISLVNWAITLPIFLALIVAGRWLLGTYGMPFTEAYPVLWRLALSQLISATVGGMGGTILAMTGNQGRAAPLIMSSAVLNLILTLWWTPLFGPVGAATATLTSVVFRAACVVYLVRRRVNVWVRPGW